MNIFLHELKAYRKSVLIWSASMGAIALLFIFIFTSMGKDIDAFKDVLKTLPEGIRLVLNIYVEGIGRLEGFYSFVFVYIVLAGAIQAMNMGIGIISKELREKTADFLFTKPVKRVTVMTAKLSAVLASLVITNAIYIIITVALATTVKSDYSMKLFVMISLSLFFVQIMFAALGVLIAVIVGRIKAPTAISLSTVFVFFIVGSLGAILGDEAVRYLSPFKYYEPSYIIQHGSYEATFVWVEITFVILSIIGSYVIYLKKDIHAV